MKNTLEYLKAWYGTKDMSDEAGGAFVAAMVILGILVLGALFLLGSGPDELKAIIKDACDVCKK